MGKILFFLAFGLFIFSIDYYAYQAIRTLFPFSTLKGKIIGGLFWSITVFLLLMVLSSVLLGFENIPTPIKRLTAGLFFIGLLAKLFIIFWLFGEDVFRVVRYFIDKLNPNKTEVALANRRKFISRASLLSALIPIGTLAYGVFKNAYNYKFHHIKLALKNTPEAFKGFKIVQLSDIHSGTFNREAPVQKVLNEINALEPDLILFTGDLVNDLASEMDHFKDIFKQLKAKHGVYSSLGNHDYGAYAFGSEDSPEKTANFNAFLEVHKYMGWNLLRNENRIIEKNGARLALVGVENFSPDGHFPGKGDLSKAIKGVEQEPFKILMSHDPSHWDYEINKKYKDIVLTLSGHTHGFQFGVETKWLRWSPSQYKYKQWAGLYQTGEQYLYVNRGFGNLGYPGRVGILPEVTVIELS